MQRKRPGSLPYVLQYLFKYCEKCIKIYFKICLYSKEIQESFSIKHRYVTKHMPNTI